MPDYHLRQQEIQKSLQVIADEIEKNENNFWQVVEAMPSVVVIIGQNGKINYVNKRVYEVFGYHPDELVGQSVDILLPEHLRNRHKFHRNDYFSKPSNRPMGRGMDLVGQRKNGNEFPVEIGLGLLDSGQIHEAIAFIVDITERKHIEEALSKSEQLLKKSQEIVHIGSWLVNLETGETIWSDKFYRICGYPPQSITPTVELGLSIIHPDDRDKAIAAFETTQRTFAPYEIEKRIIRPDGEIRWVISQGEITLDEETGIRQLAGVFIDITDRKLAQEQAHKLELEKERLQMLKTFVQNVSHEFRTPLAIINSSSYLMSRLDDKEKRHDRMLMIQEQVTRTTYLLDMLLSVVELEAVSWKLEPLLIGNIVDVALHAIRSHYADEPTLIYHIENDDYMVLGNADQLTNVIKQMLHNAYQHTPLTGTITVTVKQINNEVLISCQDTGSGIPEDDLPHIFTSFWRKDDAHTTPGFGLGLTIVKKILEIHSGHIEIRSKLNQGTTANIYLPLHQLDKR